MGRKALPRLVPRMARRHGRARERPLGHCGDRSRRRRREFFVDHDPKKRDLGGGAARVPFELRPRLRRATEDRRAPPQFLANEAAPFASAKTLLFALALGPEEPPRLAPPARPRAHVYVLGSALLRARRRVRRPAFPLGRLPPIPPARRDRR